MSIFPSDVTSSRTSGRRSETRRRPRRKCDLQNKRLHFFFHFLSCLVPFMQSDATQCLFLAARGASGESGGIRASKGLSERAPFPPGHILHYPTRWESDSPRAHTRARPIAGNSAKTKEIISPRCICSVCAPPASFSTDVAVSSAALQTNTDVTIARHRQDEPTRRGAALEIGPFRFILLES